MLSNFRAERLATHSLLVLILLLASFGCVKSAQVVSAPKHAELQPGEALLVVESESKTTWDALTVQSDVDGARYALKLKGKGDRMGFYKLPAGGYRLVGAHLPNAATEDRGFKREPSFTLRAGHLNYIGALNFEWGSDGGLYHHWRNRSGRVLTEFRSRLPTAAATLRFAYVGEEGDDWSSAMSEER